MNWLKSSSKFIVLLFCTFSLKTIAQANFQELKTKYPDSKEVVLNDVTSYDISIENKKLKVIQDNHFESIIMSENGIQNNQESIFTSDLVKLLNYEAYTIVNSNGKEKKIKVSQINDKQNSQHSVFFDDVINKQFIFPNLETGAKKIYQFQSEFKDPCLLHKFIFGDNVPVDNAVLEIKTDKNITIGFTVFNDKNNRIQFTKSEKRGKWVYQWTLKNSIPLKNEENNPGYLHAIPHILFYVSDYTVNNDKIDVLGDLPKIIKYYQAFIKDLNKKEDLELKQKALEITANLTTDDEKIKSLLYWVKNNIKYIAFENGYEGFVPREASLVYERKFGDCKDMASIISAMANYCGIKSVSVAWIGTREIPYTFSQIISPSCFNHMIAIYKKNNEYIFLDATDNETMYGMPSAFIQGKEALYYNNGNYEVVKVPIMPAEKNKVDETIHLKIVKDKIEGDGKTKFYGYNRSNILMRLGDAVNKTRFEMIKNLVVKGNNKFNLKENSEENLSDKDKPYIINYSFDLDNYIVKQDKEIYLSLFLEKYFDKMTIEKDRESKYDLDFLSNYTSHYELEIPQNYSLKYVPKNFSYENELLKINFEYVVINNKVTLNSTVETKKIVLEPSDFQEWNETLKKIKSNYTETLILNEKK